MTDAKAEVIRDQYDAVNERDWERAMSHYAEDVELVVPPQAGLHWGTFKGRDAVGRWFGDWFEIFDRDLHFEITELTELPDGSLILMAINHTRGRGSGIPVDQPVAWRYRVSDGKIVRVEGVEPERARRLASGEESA